MKGGRSEAISNSRLLEAMGIGWIRRAVPNVCVNDWRIRYFFSAWSWKERGSDDMRERESDC